MIRTFSRATAAVLALTAGFSLADSATASVAAVVALAAAKALLAADYFTDAR